VLRLSRASFGLILLAGACASRHGPSADSFAAHAGEPLFLPSGPGAESYGTPAPGPIVDGDPLRRELAQALIAAATQLRLTPPVRDPRLDRAADDLARGSPEDDPYSLPLVAFLLGHYGIIAREPSLTVVRGNPATDAELLHHVRPGLPESLKRGSWQRFGVGVHRAGPATTVIIALQEQHMELRPIPRRLPSGGSATLSGRALAEFHSPVVLLTLPDGTVRDLGVRPRDGWFQATLVCKDGDGRYEVEIAADSARGSTTLALFPVYCGVEPERGVPLSLLGRTPPQSAEAAERELFELVNRDRASAGLWLLRRDSRLDDLARAHSRAMAASGVVAHVLETSGPIEERMAKAHLRPMVVGENVGLAYSARQAQLGLMKSPGHRANILDPRVTTAGIGVVAGGPGAEGGAIQLYVTQVFAAGL
jgi:uncharacterized protein YkwD